MSNRFNAETGCLNLSRFHNDSAFLGQDVYVPLSRSSVMSNVVKIINENVPQVNKILVDKIIIFFLKFLSLSSLLKTKMYNS
jgi:hypothetical protein